MSTSDRAIHAWRNSLQASNYPLAITLGLIQGATVSAVFGYNPDISAGEDADIWAVGGEYVWPSNIGESMYIRSTDAADGQFMALSLLDAFFNPALVVVKLNGITPVVVPGGLYARINGAANADVTGFVGTVDVTDVTGTKIFSRCAPTEQASAQMVFTVPAGKRGHITQTRFTFNKSGGASGVAESRFRARRFGAAQFITSSRFGMQSTGDSAYSTVLEVSRSVPAKVDIKVSCTATTNNSDVSGIFVMALFDEELITGTGATP